MGTDSHPNRVRIAILGVTLFFCALFLAQGVTRLIAIYALPLDPSGLSAGTPSALPPLALADTGRRARDATGILRRNIFDSKTGPLDVDPATLAPPPTPEVLAQPLDPNAPPPRCDGAVRLLAAVYFPSSPSRSFASIVDASGKAKLYRSGMSIESRKLLSIGRLSVMMEVNGASRCELPMFSPPPDPNQQPVVAAAPIPPPELTPTDPFPAAAGAGGITPADMDQGITRVSDTEFRVTRNLVNRLLENQTEMMRIARVMPYEENGRVIGVKMYGIRRSGLLGRLGLSNGDVVRTINGFDMTTPDQALQAYGRLQSADHLTISVIRRGQPTTLNYGIQ